MKMKINPCNRNGLVFSEWVNSIPGKKTRCVCETRMPPQRNFFRKLWPRYFTLTLTDDTELVTNRKVLVTRYTKVKYECPKSYKSKDMANVKVFFFFFFLTNKRTDGQTDRPKIYALDLSMRRHEKSMKDTACQEYVSNISIWKSLPNSLNKRQNFGLLQIESICRRQNKSGSNDNFCLWKGWKHCGKRRKCWMFSKAILPQARWNTGLWGQGLIWLNPDFLQDCKKSFFLNTFRKK